MVAVPNVIAGQPLLPAPKGISSKFCPLKSIELPMNLSGSNNSGFTQDSLSLPIAQALAKIRVLAGISYPSMFTSSMDSLGTSTGAASRTSACAFSSTLGCVKNSVIPQSSVMKLVSVPAANMSKIIALTLSMVRGISEDSFFCISSKTSTRSLYSSFSLLGF